MEESLPVLSLRAVPVYTSFPGPQTDIGNENIVSRRHWEKLLLHLMSRLTEELYSTVLDR